MTNETRTVLIVDDDDEARDALQAVIERAGLHCLTAANGIDALGTLLANEVQVILTDHDMPIMDGIELLELVAIRHPSVCRILLTGRKDAEPAVRALNQGQAYRFLSKPCRASDLLTTLHFAFEVAQAQAESRRVGALMRRQTAIIAELHRRFPELAQELEASDPVFPR